MHRACIEQPAYQCDTLFFLVGPELSGRRIYYIEPIYLRKRYYRLYTERPIYFARKNSDRLCPKRQ